MSRIHSSLVYLVLAAFPCTALGQPGGSRGSGGDLLEIGSTLPEVTLHDEAGKALSTKRLRGHYSVLVFGCLT